MLGFAFVCSFYYFLTLETSRYLYCPHRRENNNNPSSLFFQNAEMSSSFLLLFFFFSFFFTASANPSCGIVSPVERLKAAFLELKKDFVPSPTSGQSEK
jgi:hypothetical protein